MKITAEIRGGGGARGARAPINSRFIKYLLDILASKKYITMSFL